ncbi:MAG: hypothetical protein AB7D05_04625, partial [Mangrovibacterium sp.]
MMQILYIGNDPNLIRSLTGADLNLFFVKTPGQAEKWLDRGGSPDAIICELDVPGSNALNFFRFFKRKYETMLSVPFLVVSALMATEEIQKALRLGIDDLFPKPVEGPRILRRINDLCWFRERIKKSAVYRDRTITPYQTPLLKRVFDILTASVGLLLVSPILLVCILAIRLESKGSV